MRMASVETNMVKTCPVCGADLSIGTPMGHCPVCLLRLALPGSSGESESALRVEGEVRYFGDYELLEQIATGGQGVVYRARQLGLDRLVALKLPSLTRAATPEFLERFRREGQVAASLEHPNIVPLYEAGECEGHPYLAMKWVEGEHLGQWIQRMRDRARESGTRCFDEQGGRIAQLMIKVSGAIHYAHQHGVLHRDLKPGNILVNREDEPFVTDFGLAKVLELDGDLTQTISVLGTPNYLAPELASGGARLSTVATDVYGLGAVLYQLLTGQPPFAANSPLVALRLVLDSEPVRPRAIDAEIPIDLEAICLKALNRSPKDRYASAEAMAEDLDRFLKGEPISARPVGAVGRTWRWCRRKPVLAAMIVAVAALLLAVTGVSTVAAIRIGTEARRAEQNARELRLNLYVADMNAAYHAIANNNLGLARELIRKYLPKGNRVYDGVVKETGASSTEDLRGWEWRYLWRGCQGDSLSTLRGHSSFATCAVFSPDGRTLVTASFDQTVRIWDTATKRTRHRLTGFANPIQRNSAAFSPDGKLLVVVDGADLHVFETTTWNKLRTLPNQTLAGRLFSLPIAFSPDGKTLSCNTDTGLRQWDAHSWEQRTSQWSNRVGDFGRLIVYSPPDGPRIATATDDGVEIWDATAHVPSKHFLGRLRWPTCVAFSPDAKYVSAVGIEGLAVIWDAEEGKEIRRWSADSIFPLALAFSRDGKRLATGGADQIIRLWEIEKGSLVATLSGHHNEVWALTFSPDGRTLVSTSKDGTARLWSAEPEIATGKRLTLGTALHFSPDGSTLTLFTTNSTVQHWDVRSKHLVSTSRIPVRPQQLDSIDTSPDGRLLALVGANGIARVWDQISGELIAELLLDSPPKWPSAVFSPDSRLLAISSGPRDIGDGGWSVVWDFRLRKPLALPGENVYRPAFSPEGRILATGSGSDVQLWSIPGLKPLATLRGHKWTINSLTFSPDGSVLASAGRDNDILLWEVATGKLKGVLSGHQTSSGRPAFSSDGRTLASVAPARVILWNVATGRELLTMSGLDRYINSCMFSPDGNTLVVGGTQGALAMAPVELLQAPPLAEVEAAEKADVPSP